MTSQEAIGVNYQGLFMYEEMETTDPTIYVNTFLWRHRVLATR